MEFFEDTNIFHFKTDTYDETDFCKVCQIWKRYTAISA